MTGARGSVGGTCGLDVRPRACYGEARFGNGTMWLALYLRLQREGLRLVLRPLDEGRRKRAERWHRGLEDHLQLRRADAVVVSFGKSGRTWLRTLLSRYYQLRGGLSPRTLIGMHNLARGRVPRIFFTHDNYLKDFTGHRDDKRDYYDRRVVLLVRDPRDVAVSQFFQWKYRMRDAKKWINDYPRGEVSLFDFVMGPAGLARVIDFLNGWARELDRLRALHLLRYEDLRADTEGELARLLAFLGERPDPGAVAESVRYASVENMRRLEAERRLWLAGRRLRPGDRANPESYKVRRAKVGGYRDYFDDRQVEAIDALLAARLDPVFGYQAVSGEGERELQTRVHPC